mmetsp:Transcript_16134/g.47856  ORF Transcript_16134/g.47856 Transcript_16134/m.47856 type:complete len:232 (-) Transcript_16134:180-875(-)
MPRARHCGLVRRRVRRFGFGCHIVDRAVVSWDALVPDPFPAGDPSGGQRGADLGGHAQDGGQQPAVVLHQDTHGHPGHRHHVVGRANRSEGPGVQIFHLDEHLRAPRHPGRLRPAGAGRGRLRGRRPRRLRAGHGWAGVPAASSARPGVSTSKGGAARGGPADAAAQGGHIGLSYKDLPAAATTRAPGLRVPVHHPQPQRQAGGPMTAPRRAAPCCAASGGSAARITASPM